MQNSENADSVNAFVEMSILDYFLYQSICLRLKHYTPSSAASSLSSYSSSSSSSPFPTVNDAVASEALLRAHSFSLHIHRMLSDLRQQCPARQFDDLVKRRIEMAKIIGLLFFHCDASCPGLAMEELHTGKPCCMRHRMKGYRMALDLFVTAISREYKVSQWHAGIFALLLDLNTQIILNDSANQAEWLENISELLGDGDASDRAIADSDDEEQNIASLVAAMSDGEDPGTTDPALTRQSPLFRTKCEQRRKELLQAISSGNFKEMQMMLLSKYPHGRFERNMRNFLKGLSVVNKMPLLARFCTEAINQYKSKKSQHGSQATPSQQQTQLPLTQAAGATPTLAKATVEARGHAKGKHSDEALKATPSRSEKKKHQASTRHLKANGGRSPYHQPQVIDEVGEILEALHEFTRSEENVPREQQPAIISNGVNAPQAHEKTVRNSPTKSAASFHTSTTGQSGSGAVPLPRKDGSAEKTYAVAPERGNKDQPKDRVVRISPASSPGSVNFAARSAATLAPPPSHPSPKAAGEKAVKPPIASLEPQIALPAILNQFVSGAVFRGGLVASDEVFASIADCRHPKVVQFISKRQKLHEAQAADAGKTSEKPLASKMPSASRSLLHPANPGKVIDWSDELSQHGLPTLLSSNENSERGNVNENVKVAAEPPSAATTTAAAAAAVPPSPRPLQQSQTAVAVANVAPINSRPAAASESPNGKPIKLHDSVKRVEPAAANTPRKKSRRPFSASENANLRAGFAKFGKDWVAILKAYSFDNRTNVDLKDRARTLERHNELY